MKSLEGVYNGLLRIHTYIDNELMRYIKEISNKDKRFTRLLSKIDEDS
jgi:hypothetical protein